MNVAAIEKLITALIELAPEVLDIVERLVNKEKARRVEAVRPAEGHGHAEDAAERLRTGGTTPTKP